MVLPLFSPRLIATVTAFTRLTTQTSAIRPSPVNDAFSFPLATDADTGNSSIRKVATDGWLKTSEQTAIELARQFDDQPLAGIVYTDISRDGMMQGPNLDAMREMAAAVSIPVIASGGVSSADDVRRLAATGVAGCIVGRALYEGKIDLKQLIATLNTSLE